ncbi:SMP-30/gluconolactonase/LRE family protein [candidate division KSB1 bacterium]
MRALLSVLLGVLLVSTVFAAGPVEVIDKEFSQVVSGRAKLVTIGADFEFTEGPVWIAKKGKERGHLLFSDIPADKIYRWGPKEKLTVFREPSGKSNGLLVGPRGGLLACEHWNRRVTQTLGGGTVISLCDYYLRKPLNSPNDIAIGPDKTLWFTDPPYGLEGREQIQENCNVFVFGQAWGEPKVAVSDFNRPNGIVFSPDKSVVYVADSGKPHHVRSFKVITDTTVTPAAYGVDDGKVFCVITPGGPDGMAVDVDGRLYVTAGDGVQVFRADGKLIGKILTPKVPANCCFGGDDMKTLYMTAREAVYSIKLKVVGLP